MSSLFPWQHTAWESLCQAHQLKRLPHGLLITARRGTGAEQFVHAWSHYLLCQSAESRPCGQCKSCLLFRSGTHPDYYWVETLEDKKQISIAQIRQLTKELQETAHMSQWRVAVIDDAEKLTINGYNALLKTLEEPGSQTQLILIAKQRSAIPATIISRCQHLDLDPKQKSQARGWLSEQLPDSSSDTLELALSVNHYAPIAALDWIKQKQQPVFEQAVESLLGVFEGKSSSLAISDNKLYEPDSLLAWWEYLVVIMLMSRQNGLILDVSLLKRAAKLAENADERLLFNIRDNILFQLKELRDGVALNMPMQLDALAYQWSRCGNSAS